MIPPLLKARTTDPETSHAAMSQTKPDKILNSATAVKAMLEHDSYCRTTDTKRPEGGLIQLAGLSDWEMVEMWADVENPARAYLDAWRSAHPATGGNNVGGFIRMGRKHLVENGYVIDSGWIRTNKYLSTTYGRRQARRGAIWHLPAQPIQPPGRAVVVSRKDLEKQIARLEAEVAELRKGPAGRPDPS